MSMKLIVEAMAAWAGMCSALLWGMWLLIP
jgi:hypothetical protein